MKSALARVISVVAGIGIFGGCHCAPAARGLPPCASGLTSCEQTCVDLQSDAKDCGRCGVRCLWGELCSAGTCVPDCSQGLAFEGVPRSNIGDSNTYWVAVDLDLDGELDWAAIDAEGHVRVYFVPEATAGYVSQASGVTLLRTGDVDGDGHPDLVALPGGFVIFAGAGRPLRELPFAAPSGKVEDALLADLDGNGRADLVVATNDPGAVVYRHSLGRAGFGPDVGLVTGIGNHAGLASGDIDGDGVMDLVVNADQSVAPDPCARRLLLFTGSPAGPNRSPRTIGDVVGCAAEVVVADCDGDGRLDVVTSTTIGRNRATGLSVEPAEVPLLLRNPVVGDLDGDGTDDIVTSDLYVFGTVVLRGLGECRFEQSVLPALGVGRPAIVDIDHDGLLDIGVAGAWNRALAPGRFRSPPGVAIPRAALGITGDFDGNGRAELSILEFRGDDAPFRIWSAGADSNGKLAVVNLGDVSLTKHDAGWGYFGANIDGLGREDLVVWQEVMNAPTASAQVQSFRTNGEALNLIGTAELSPLTYHFPEFFDLDGDGRSDILQSSFDEVPDTGVALIFWRGIGDGTFQAPQEIRLDSAVGTTIEGFHICDRDFDGKPDIVISGADASGARVVIVALQRADLTFFETAIHLPQLVDQGLMGRLGSHDLAVDVDGDGVLDIATWTGGTDQTPDVWWLRGTRDGSFSEPHEIRGAVVKPAYGSYLFYGSFADVDRDGKSDNIEFDQDGLIVRLGRGDGTFSAPQRIGLHPDLASFRYGPFADFDGDGRLDFVWVDSAGLDQNLHVSRGVCGAR